MSILEVKNITMLYNGKNGVRNISFSIEKQGVYGFLGPNGAGKSTTMNIMTGCLAATEGTVTINEFDIYQDPVYAKMLIGYLPEQPPLYMERTPREYLNFVAEAKGIVRQERKAHVEEVMNRVGITDVADRLIKYLSKGYKQRVGIAQAIIGDPDIIILDEPTVGLDPAQILEIRQLIRDLGKDHTVILSSHILQEVNAVCDKLIIISKGRLVAIDTPENLEARFAGDNRINMVVGATKKECEEILSGISAVVNPRITPIESDDKKANKVRISLGYTSKSDDTVSPDHINTCDDVIADIFFAFADKRKVIYELTNTKAGLEEIFLELTGVPEESDNKEAVNKEAINKEETKEAE